MIVKIKSRKSFAAVADYITRKDHNPKFFFSRFLFGNNKKDIVRQMEVWSKMKPGRSNPVVHLFYSFAIEDGSVSDELARKVVERHLNLMGYANTQAAFWWHSDHDYMHIHGMLNRVDQEGNWISESNERYRNMRICKQLCKEFGLYIAPGKRNVKIGRLHGREKMRYQMYNKVMLALHLSITWKDFEEELAKLGIQMKFRYDHGGRIVKGISFTNGQVCFGGSRLDRSLSFRQLDKILGGLTPQRDYYDLSHDRDSDTGQLLYPEAKARIKSDVPHISLTDFCNEICTPVADVMNDVAESIDEGTLVGLDALMTFLLPPTPDVSIGTGGGGGGSSYDDDRRRRRKEEAQQSNDYIPTKRRRR